MSNRLKLLLILITMVSCGSINKKDTSRGTSNNSLQDTMFLNGKTRFLKTPDSQGERITSLERCTVIVLEKKAIPNVQTSTGIDSFVKVKTQNNLIGYVWKEVLISLPQLKAHNDSLAMWAKQPMPIYKNLIGKSYWTNADLPFELAPGAFSSMGEENPYGIISVSNRYTDRYSYLFFVKNTGKYKDDRINELVIHDIIPLNWEEYGADAQPWFQQCQCVDSSEDCFDVIAIYKHTEEMARQEIKVTPLKAWRPDYSKPALIEIDVKSVQCGSISPDLMENAEY